MQPTRAPPSTTPSRGGIARRDECPPVPCRVSAAIGVAPVLDASPPAVWPESAEGRRDAGARRRRTHPAEARSAARRRVRIGAVGRPAREACPDE